MEPTLGSVCVCVFLGMCMRLYISTIRSHNSETVENIGLPKEYCFDCFLIFTLQFSQTFETDTFRGFAASTAITELVGPVA